MANGKNSDLDILLNARLDTNDTKGILSDISSLTDKLKDQSLSLKIKFDDSEIKNFKKEIDTIQKSLSEVSKGNSSVGGFGKDIIGNMQEAKKEIKDVELQIRNIDGVLSKKRQFFDDKNLNEVKRTILEVDQGLGRTLKITESTKQEFELITNRAQAQKEIYSQLNQLAREESQIRSRMFNARGQELEQLQKMLNTNQQNKNAIRDIINSDREHLQNKSKESELQANLNKLLDEQLYKQSQIAQREEERISRLGEKISGNKGIEGVDFGDIKSVNEYVQALMGAEVEVNNVREAHNKFRNGLSDTSKQIHEITAVQKVGHNQLKEYKFIVDENTNSMYKLGESLNPIPNKMMGMVSQMGEAIIKSAQWAVAMDLIYGNLRRLKEGIEIVKALDVELTNVAVTLGLSRKEAQDYADTITSTAINLRRSVADVSAVNTELVRQGLSLEESAKRMETVMKFASVGDMGAQESLRVITSSVNALGEEAEKTADVLLMAGQISASSAGEIGEAFTKTAASAKATGVELEELGAILSVLIETTQESPSSLGNSLKTLISRFNQINEETGELNEDLNQVQTAFESVGVAFTDAEGQIRPLYDLLQDLSPIWNELDKNTRSYISTQAAGKINYIVPVSIAI